MGNVVSRARRTGAIAPLIVAVGLGATAGLGGYTFGYAKGFSYFGTAPEACVNCHIMQPQYDGWSKSSHHDVAVCVDCHLPEAFPYKYVVKAENGWRHGKLFTTQQFVEPIVLQPAAQQILQDNCVRCHSTLVDSIHASPVGDREGMDDLACVHCHASAGHGARAGLGPPLSRTTPSPTTE